MKLPSLITCRIGVIGLGYVGLPLAVELSKSKECLLTKIKLERRVIGFDINKERINELLNGYDLTKEFSSEELKKADFLEFTHSEERLTNIDVFIVTVPTPIDISKQPDFEPLKNASRLVARVISRRNSEVLPIIIFESTVYPGATEEICVKIIEEETGLKYRQDFGCGYSPERINPGDKQHTLTSIKKVTSGSDLNVAQWVDKFYGSIIIPGTYLAKSIKVAEAAKVIENTQRDLNIALINELSIIFKIMNIDTLDVLSAARTKWNFLDFKPGLVGGHCIGVDPYYLTYKAQQLGYYPEVVLAGRRINDNMPKWIAEQLILSMAKKEMIIGGQEVLILGLAFKANCPDIRNTRIIDLIKNLRSYGLLTTVVDPYVNINDAEMKYQLQILNKIPKDHKYGSIIAAVDHKEFSSITYEEWLNISRKDTIYIDVKGILPRELNPIRI
ncbi:Vi polysaccharide biosynthesis protein VipA/TviB [bacterium]|nr:Vi polysaccharide biosynthesis protein VipA/TviB [bacterium]|tara:strand:- start:3023 stop:4357 length:1335 start_codon:yes stop_codon:yes gene_type:complete